MDTTAGDNVNGDQKVTNAVVKKDLDRLNETIKELVQEVKENNRANERRFHALELHDTQQDERVAVIAEDVKELKSKDTAGTIGSLLVGLFASLVAIFRP